MRKVPKLHSILKPALNLLQFLHDLVYVEKVSPPAEQDPYDDFGRGLVAMYIEGSWGMGDFGAIETLNYTTPWCLWL